MAVPRGGIGFPAHSTASGKVLLAFLPEADRQRYLAEDLCPMTRATVTDKKVLAVELEGVRRNGYALDNGEAISGIGCVAAPIRDQDGLVVAAVSLSGMAEEVLGDQFSEAVKDVREAAAEISRTLGYMS